MHDDAVAQTFGFRGGLVPGVDVWRTDRLDVVVGPGVALQHAPGISQSQLGQLQRQRFVPGVEGQEHGALFDAIAGLEIDCNDFPRGFGKQGYGASRPCCANCLYACAPLA